MKRPMDCDRYRDQYTFFIDSEQPPELFESDEYAEWFDHQEECGTCLEWSLERAVRDRGEDPARFPCLHMAFYATDHCEEHPDPLDCGDRVIIHDQQFDRYGIPVEDSDGPSMLVIQFCPWCGASLSSAEDQPTDQR